MKKEWLLEWDENMGFYCLSRRVKDVYIIVETGTKEAIIKYCRENGIYIYQVKNFEA